MELNGRKNGDTLTVAMTGELDQQVVEDVRRRIDNVLRDTSIRNIVFDMSGVSFMDSSGIGVLLGRYKLIAARRGSMRIEGANGTVYKILRMSGMGNFITDGGYRDEK